MISFKIRITDPNHVNFGEEVDATYMSRPMRDAYDVKGHKTGEREVMKIAATADDPGFPTGYFIHAWRPFDPEKPVSKDYREYNQIINLDAADPVSGWAEALTEWRKLYTY